MTGKANEALHIMGSWWWPKLEIRTGEQRSLTYEVRTQNRMPGLIKVQWMLVFAGWKRILLVFMCTYSLVSGFSLSWSSHFELCLCCGSALSLVQICFSLFTHVRYS